MTIFFKLKWISSFLVSVIIIGCSSNTNGPDSDGKVMLSSPTVEQDGSLSLNASARFDAEVSDLEDISELIYKWSLQEARGTLVVNDQVMGSQAQTTTPYVIVRGDRAGEETLSVKVMNDQNGSSLGEDLLSFEITSPSGASKCFNEPLLFFRTNDWFNPVITAIGLESDTKITNNPSAQNWLLDISKDGIWFLRQDFSDITNYVLWLDACDGSESRLLAEGLQIESPTFGPNDMYVYYSELIEYPAQTEDPRAKEIVRLNIETGEKVFISGFGVFSKKPIVSPDGNWIAFEHSKSTFNASGSYTGSIIHLAVMPSEGGPAQLLVPIVDGRLGGIDWSPDSKNIIFYFNENTENNGSLTEGIYRVDLNGGSSPSFLYSQGKGSAALEIAYYANGTRIAFEGNPDPNDSQFDIWSIDANGADLQRLTDEQYNVFLSFFWEP